MANRIVSVHAGVYGIGIYAIMLPSSGFSVAHSTEDRDVIEIENIKEMTGIWLLVGVVRLPQYSHNRGFFAASFCEDFSDLTNPTSNNYN